MNEKERKYRPNDPANPDYYRLKDVETCDMIRQRCIKRWGRFIGMVAFQGWCFGSRLKYEDRIGHKEGQSKEKEETKIVWYNQMDMHIETNGKIPDPRDT